MHNLLRLAVLGSLCLGMALSVFADSSNRWGNYRGVERPAKPLPPPQYRPPHQRPPKLPAPPRGYRWVLSSGYYQLVPVQ